MEGCIAQLVEQWPLKPTVAGSNPATPTKRIKYWIRPDSSTDRAGLF